MIWRTKMQAKVQGKVLLKDSIMVFLVAQMDESC
jgi:hypothetical protein